MIHLQYERSKNFKSTDQFYICVSMFNTLSLYNKLRFNPLRVIEFILRSKSRHHATKCDFVFRGMKDIQNHEIDSQGEV